MTFNRTSMELKPPLPVRSHAQHRSFNRTSMELKHFRIMRAIAVHDTFNRTSMELKPYPKASWACDTPCF